MAEIDLVAERRSESGKKYAKHIRKEEKVPGVYYAHGEDTIPILVDTSRLQDVLASGRMIINLDLGGKRMRKTIVKEVQYDPVFEDLLHVDLMGIKMDKPIDVPIPIHLEGTPLGVKVSGGVLQQPLRALMVRALPADIPDEVVVNVEELEVGDSLHVRDVPIENVDVLVDPDLPVVTVIHPTIIIEPEVVEEELEEIEGEEVEEGAEEEKAPEEGAPPAGDKEEGEK